MSNTARPGGDGSRGAPFQRLKDAEARSATGDAIVVLRGDGTDRGQDEGIRLKDGQRLVGEGFDPKTLEATGPGGAPPILGNRGGDGVVLASGSVVLGIEVKNARGAGLVLEGPGDVTVRRVRIEGSGDDGIKIRVGANATATVTIEETTLESNRTVGIHAVASDQARLTLAVTGCTFRGGEAALDLDTERSGTLRFRVEENRELSGGAGTIVNVFQGSDTTAASRLEGTIARNRKMSKLPGAGHGIRVVASGSGHGKVDVLDNVIGSGVLSDSGIVAESRDGDGRLDVTLAGNTVEVGPDAANAILVQSRDRTALHAKVERNSVPASGGIRVRRRDASTLRIEGIEKDQDAAAVEAFLRRSNPGTRSITCETAR